MTDGPLTDREMVSEARKLADAYLADRMNVAGVWLHTMADTLERVLDENDRLESELSDIISEMPPRD